MLKRLLALFAAKEQTSEIPEAKRVQIAACAILLEVAGADNEFAPEECQRIIAVLRERFELGQDEAEELVRTAEERRTKAFDLWHFTSQINASCSRDEKLRIIEEVWRVIYADGRLDGHEDYLAHKLAQLLNLTHPQLIEAKMKVRSEFGGND